jgi:hypothetical protein
MHKQEVDFQLVPPHVHRRNAAKRAIRTCLCSVNPNFPMTLWDTLLPQATLSLNLLQTSRINPQLSAYAQLFGNFDYNRMPLAPPGTKVVAHKKANKCSSWAPHGATGWYIGPALEQYCCHTIFISKTNAKRICDTVKFFPHNFTMPKLSSSDATLHAARDLICHPQPSAPPFAIGDQQLVALRQLANIFDAAHPRVAGEKEPPQSTGLATKPVLTNSPPPQVTKQLPLLPATPLAFPPLPSQMLAQKTIQLPSQDTPDTPLDEMFLEPPASDPLPSFFFGNAIINPDTRKSMEFKELISTAKTQKKWQRSSANEFRRLAQGLKRGIIGTGTVKFIPCHEVPSDPTIMYARFVCTIQPQKAKPECT